MSTTVVVHDEQDVLPYTGKYVTGFYAPVTVQVRVWNDDAVGSTVVSMEVVRCTMCMAPAEPPRSQWDPVESCSTACQRAVDDAVDHACEREWC